MALSSILGACVLLLAPSGYVHVGVLRAIRGSILAEIVLEAVMAVWTIASGGLSLSTSASVGAVWPLLSAWWIAALMLSGRVPFDVVEAESELVSGALTELLGVAFSLALLAEAAELFLCVSLVVSLVWTGGLVSLAAIGAVTTAYIGRVLLVRYRVAEMATIAFVILL
jgi:NADH:ubiquinone oxidoreductase subunit H